MLLIRVGVAVQVAVVVGVTVGLTVGVQVALTMSGRADVGVVAQVEGARVAITFCMERLGAEGTAMAEEENEICRPWMLNVPFLR